MVRAIQYVKDCAAVTDVVPCSDFFGDIIAEATVLISQPENNLWSLYAITPEKTVFTESGIVQ